MTRWNVEKSGTGIEGAGTGIEKYGTGIEGAGTGIEKSGTGLRKLAIASALTAICFAANASPNKLGPEASGPIQLVVENNKVAVSWIFDGSIFSGTTKLQGSYANVLLTEISLATPTKPSPATPPIEHSKDVVGGGTGTDVVGGGTGTDQADPNSAIFVVGGGTGTDAIAITLPSGTGLSMEVKLSCSAATVTVVDTNSAEVVTFENVQVIGDTGMCNGFDGFDNRNMGPRLR